MKRSTVPVRLVRIDDEKLETRSQARELIALFRDSDEIVLDFEDVESIGFEFADEIFRVFKQEHPRIMFSLFGANQQIEEAVSNIYEG